MAIHQKAGEKKNASGERKFSAGKKLASSVLLREKNKN